MKCPFTARMLVVIGAALLFPVSAWAQELEERIDDPELKDVPLVHERRALPPRVNPPAPASPPVAAAPPAPATPNAGEDTSDDDFLQLEQRIRDSELEGVPLRSELPPPPPDPEASESETKTAAASESAGAGGDGELIIDDPELTGKKVAGDSDADLRTTFQLELHTRVGIDTNWSTTNKRENVIEGTQIALLDVNFRRSEKLRFAVGLRGRYRFMRMQEKPSEDESAETYELDVVPTAGYADATLADGLHLRLGYQTISMGRFDFFTAVNFLAVSDLRDGPATMPGASAIAQPAVRVDLDLASWLTVQAFYVPFFQPHLISVYGSDYSILAPLDNTSDEDAQALLDLFGRNSLREVSQSALEALSPQPDLTRPQAALRVSARIKQFEVAVTAGVARDHSPTFDPNDDLRTFLNEEESQQTRDEALQALSGVPAEESLGIDYPHYYVLSLDAATGIGPVQLGFEVTYLKDWTLYAGETGDAAPLPRRVPADLLHLGLRAEWVDADIQTLAEIFYEHAIEEPPAGQQWVSLQNRRYLAGVAGGVRFTPGGGKFSVDAVVTAAVGPSVVLTPRLEYALAENLWIELGAILVEGRRPATIGDPKATVGGIYDDTDQVFTGLRWMP